MEIDEALDEGSTLTTLIDKKLVQIQLYSVIDGLLSPTDWRH